MSRLLDKRNPDGSFPFRYTNSASTSVKDTIERAKREIEQQKLKEKEALQWRLRNVIAAKKAK